MILSRRNDFDNRYLDVADTPKDIMVGGGEMEVSLSAIKKAMGTAPDTSITDSVTGKKYKWNMDNGALFLEEVL
jgi:hypothetical protein